MFITDREPPEKRRRFATGGTEKHFSEAAVMLAFALDLLNQPGSSGTVSVHPDGEHAKRFDIISLLTHSGFAKTECIGTTPYGGRYTRNHQTIIVNPRSGQGDVVGEINGQRIVAECKGGAINTTHSGQKSHLRKRLYESIGQLLGLPVDGARHVAVLPITHEVEKVAAKLAPRTHQAGIEICLVHSDGRVEYIESINHSIASPASIRNG